MTSINPPRRFTPVTVTTALLSCLLLSSGCMMVGPNYERPDAGEPDAWSEATAGDFSTNAPALGGWWKSFNDPVLNQLITDADAGNLSLKIVAERINEAAARRGIERSQLWPQLTGFGDASATQTSGGILPGGDSVSGEHYSLGADFAWELDLWGRVRRSVESADAALEGTLEDYRDAAVILYAQIGAAYIEVRTVQQRIKYATENIRNQTDTLKLTTDRNSAGLVPILDVAQAELNVRTSESALPTFRSSLNAAINRLAVLSGKYPGELHKLLLESAIIPSPAEAIATGVPVTIIRQRPDVRSAERALASQHARIGVAKGELYPTFALPGTFALEALDAGDLFESGSLGYSFGPVFRWNLFSAGRIKNNIRVEESRTQQALFSYKQSLLTAVEDVENAMVALTEERSRVESLQQAVSAAQRSVTLVKDLYSNGLVDFQNVLDMERSLAAQQDSYASSKGLVSQNAVRLYKSLGGGWDAAPAPEVVLGEPAAE
jgi:multidrug efflux system outer membrane protein